MQNNKSPGNDRLTKEFYKMFWNEIKHPFMNSIMEARETKKLITAQHQAKIKLIEKKERDERFTKNWCPISLLNVDYKIVAKALATRLKETLPKVISFQQMAYVCFLQATCKHIFLFKIITYICILIFVSLYCVCEINLSNNNM